MTKARIVVATLASMLMVGGAALAQDANLPTKEQLANDNKQFLTLATKALHWEEPQEPLHIAGALYYVGTKGLASFLFSTREGLILLNTGDPTSGPMIKVSIEKLGFDVRDIKVMINGHGHSDHAGGFAYLRELAPDAKLMIMEGDVPMIEDGGKSDFHYGKDWRIMGQEPVKVDHVLSNGEVVSLGDVSLTAYNTPGHTRGSTSWVTQLTEVGKVYNVVFPDGGGFNPGIQARRTRCRLSRHRATTTGRPTTFWRC